MVISTNTFNHATEVDLSSNFHPTHPNRALCVLEHNELGRPIYVVRNYLTGEIDRCETVLRHMVDFCNENYDCNFTYQS